MALPPLYYLRFSFNVAVDNYIHSYNNDNLYRHDKLELYGEPYINDDGRYCQLANDDKYNWILEMVNGKIRLVFAGERKNPS